jgi:hypothetical protein
MTRLLQGSAVNVLAGPISLASVDSEILIVYFYYRPTPDLTDKRSICLATSPENASSSNLLTISASILTPPVSGEVEKG